MMKSDKKTNKIVDDYISFQKESLSPFHVVSEIEKRLLSKAYKKLSFEEPWNLEGEGN